MNLRRVQSVELATVERMASEARSVADRLRVQRDRLAAVVGASGDGVVVVDPDGIELLRNAPAARYRGARHGDAVVERTVEELLVEARSGKSLEHELQLYGPPRERLLLRGVPLRDGDRVLGAAVFIQDVSELHRVQSVRRDFVANVSHELKTPVGAVGVLAETLAAEDDPAVIRPLAERLAREAERLGRLVDDLLDLSLLESEETPTRRSERVGALVDEAVDRVRPAAVAAAIELQVDDGAAAAALRCDRRQVVSALANLLDNAVKYSEPEGSVLLSVEARDGQVVFRVRDEGIGIPAKDLERIFERFYRVDQARSRATGGTGLGLAIVRHVARSHGGEVSARSVEGEGSEFELVLPLGGAAGEVHMGGVSK